MYEQDLLDWFNNRKLAALGFIMDGVFLANTTEKYDVGNNSLIKPYRTISLCWNCIQWIQPDVSTPQNRSVTTTCG